MQNEQMREVWLVECLTMPLALGRVLKAIEKDLLEGCDRSLQSYGRLRLRLAF